MRNLLILLALLTVSCGVEDRRPIRVTNELFRPYINMFEEKLGHSIGDVPIDFYPQDEGTAGSCYYYSGNKRMIGIDQQYWEEGMDESMKINLIFHELGHCVLNLEHDETEIQISFTYPDGYVDTRFAPKSFMYPAVFFQDWMSSQTEYYKDELFNK